IHSATQMEFESLRNNVKFLSNQNSTLQLEITKLGLDNETKDREIDFLVEKVRTLEKINASVGRMINVGEPENPKNQVKFSQASGILSEKNSPEYLGISGLNQKLKSLDNSTLNNESLSIKDYENQIRDLRNHIEQLVAQNNLLANANAKLMQNKETKDDLYQRIRYLENELAGVRKEKESLDRQVVALTMELDKTLGDSSVDENLGVKKKLKIRHVSS
ncbi:8521_t:CDS:1, partial [Acaulospora morrowiae]